MKLTLEPSGIIASTTGFASDVGLSTLSDTSIIYLLEMKFLAIGLQIVESTQYFLLIVTLDQILMR